GQVVAQRRLVGGEERLRLPQRPLRGVLVGGRPEVEEEVHATPPGRKCSQPAKTDGGILAHRPGAFTRIPGASPGRAGDCPWWERRHEVGLGRSPTRRRPAPAALATDYGLTRATESTWKCFRRRWSTCAT